jgi:hypothetical protein
MREGTASPGLTSTVESTTLHGAADGSVFDSSGGRAISFGERRLMGMARGCRLMKEGGKATLVKSVRPRLRRKVQTGSPRCNFGSQPDFNYPARPYSDGRRKSNCLPLSPSAFESLTAPSLCDILISSLTLQSSSYNTQIKLNSG